MGQNASRPIRAKSGKNQGSCIRGECALLILLLALVSCDNPRNTHSACEIPDPVIITATDQYPPFQISHIILWSGYPLIESVFGTDPRNGNAVPHNTILQAGDILLAVDDCDARNRSMVGTETGFRNKVSIALWSPSELSQYGIQKLLIQRANSLVLLRGPLFDSPERLDGNPPVNFQAAPEIPGLAGTWLSRERGMALRLNRLHEVYTMRLNSSTGRALLFGEVHISCDKEGHCQADYSRSRGFRFRLEVGRMVIITPLPLEGDRDPHRPRLAPGEILVKKGLHLQ